MIAPILPGALDLAESLQGKVDSILMDRMNYNHANWVYRQHGLEDALRDDFFEKTESELASRFRQSGIVCDVARDWNYRIGVK